MRRTGWERPNPSFVLGFWLYGAGSQVSRRQRALGGRISGKANINLRKTLPLAGRRPSFRASAALATELTGPARSEPPIQRPTGRAPVPLIAEPAAAHTPPY